MQIISDFKHMSFENPAFEEEREKKEKEIFGYEDAVDYLIGTGEDGAKSEPFQKFVEQKQEETDAINDHVPRLVMSLRMAAVYYLAGFREYAMESLEEIEEADMAEDLRAGIEEIKEKMEAGEKIGSDFFDKKFKVVLTDKEGREEILF